MVLDERKVAKNSARSLYFRAGGKRPVEAIGKHVHVMRGRHPGDEPDAAAANPASPLPSSSRVVRAPARRSKRLSHRLDFTQAKTAEKIEQDLVQIVPKKDWVIFSHLLIAHGRKICKARNPLCDQCPVEKQCPSSFLKTGVHPGN